MGRVETKLLDSDYRLRATQSRPDEIMFHVKHSFNRWPSKDKGWSYQRRGYR